MKRERERKKLFHSYDPLPKMEMMSFIEFVVCACVFFLLLWLKSTVLIAWALSESYMMRRMCVFFFQRYHSGEIQIGNWKRNKNKFCEWVCTLLFLSLAQNRINDHLSFILWINKFQMVSDGLWFTNYRFWTSHKLCVAVVVVVRSFCSKSWHTLRYTIK